MTRLLASDPQYEEINRHQQMLCMIHNPHMYFDLADDFDAIPAEEQLLLWDDVRAGMQKLLSGVPLGFLRDHFNEEW